jgi:hypothetical protein
MWHTVLVTRYNRALTVQLALPSNMVCCACMPCHCEAVSCCAQPTQLEPHLHRRLTRRWHNRHLMSKCAAAFTCCHAFCRHACSAAATGSTGSGRDTHWNTPRRHTIDALLWMAARCFQWCGVALLPKLASRTHAFVDPSIVQGMERVHSS